MRRLSRVVRLSALKLCPAWEPSRILARCTSRSGAAWELASDRSCCCSPPARGPRRQGQLFWPWPVTLDQSGLRRKLLFTFHANTVLAVVPLFPGQRYYGGGLRGMSGGVAMAQRVKDSPWPTGEPCQLELPGRRIMVIDPYPWRVWEGWRWLSGE